MCKSPIKHSLYIVIGVLLLGSTMAPPLSPFCSVSCHFFHPFTLLSVSITYDLILFSPHSFLFSLSVLIRLTINPSALSIYPSQYPFLFRIAFNTVFLLSCLMILRCFHFCPFYVFYPPPIPHFT